MKFLMILSLTFLTACHSGWDKDPFAGDAVKIKNAITPDTKIVKIPPPEQNTLFSDLSRVHNIHEGEQLSIKVDAKSSHQEVILTNIIIKDLDKIFPDSSYDFATRRLLIRPGYETVPADKDYETKTLEVIFESAYEDKNFSVSYEIVILVLPTNTEPPVISRIPSNKLPSPMVTGKNYQFNIDVLDTSSEYSPRVQAYDRFFSSNTGAQFVKISPTGTQSPSNPNIWTFTVEVRLPVDLQAKSNGLFNSIDFIAYSVSGIPSRAESLSFTVYPEATPPTFLTTKSFSVKKGSEFKYLFAVVDELNRGRVSVTCPSLPNNVSCSCQNSLFVGEPSQCRLSWIPDQEGVYNIKWEATNIVTQGSAGQFSRAVKTEEIKITVN